MFTSVVIYEVVVVGDVGAIGNVVVVVVFIGYYGYNFTRFNFWESNKVVKGWKSLIWCEVVGWCCCL